MSGSDLNFANEYQKPAYLAHIDDLKALVRKVFSSVEGKKLMQILDDCYAVPTLPVNPKTIEVHGDIKSWLSYRAGQNSVIYLFKSYIKESNDHVRRTSS